MFHVKQEMTLERLFVFLQDQDMALSEIQKERVWRYYELLRRWAAKQNLLSKKDSGHIIERHFVPSFYYAYRLKQSGFSGRRLLDLGSGAGFPGILLSIYFEDSPCVLLEASRKKSLFLRRVTRELGLKAMVWQKRAEQLSLSEEERFPVVVARAVAPMPELIRLSAFLIQKQGVLYSLKGEGYLREYTQGKRNAVSSLKELPIPGEWLDFSNYLKGKTLLRLEF